MAIVSDSEAIRNDIRRAWDGVLKARIDKGQFDNYKDPWRKKSRIATAEGLNTLFIPAVQDDALLESLLDTFSCNKDEIVEDIDWLINATILKVEGEGNVPEEVSAKKGFFSDPYWSPELLKKALRPEVKKKSVQFEHGWVETIDSVSYVCASMIYVWRLFDELAGGEDFIKGRKKVTRKNVIKVISESIAKLIDWHKPNEGWGWGPGEFDLVTDLYSTWTACETIGEIDDYILKDIKDDNIIQSLFGFKPDDLWNCIRETKDYMIDSYLQDMVTQGIPVEICVAEGKSLMPLKAESPEILKLNNDLYALDILLLTYADKEWSDNRPIVDEDNEEVQGMLELAQQKIMNLYYSDDKSLLQGSDLSYRKYLSSREYYFLLDTGSVLNPKQLRPENEDWFLYSDMSFLPLFLRVTAQSLRYGSGNPILLERLVEQLYVDLLLSKQTSEQSLRHCWSGEDYSIYSTERAIEALTDLMLFYREKEREIGGPGGGGISIKKLMEIKEVFLKAGQDIETIIIGSRIGRDIEPPGNGETTDPVNNDSPGKKPECVAVNIEFAHVREYFKLGDDELLDPTARRKVLEDNLGNQLKHVKRAISDVPEDDFTLCVLLDDYNYQTKLEDKEFRDDLQELDDKLDVQYVMRESKLTDLGEVLIGMIKEKQNKVEVFAGEGGTGETILFWGSGKKRILLKTKPKHGEEKYECGLLAACWYLMRLGEEPFASEGMKEISSFSTDRPFFGKRIENYMSRDNEDAEEITRIIIESVYGKDFYEDKIDTILK